MCCLGLACVVKVGVAPAEECETLATTASSSAQCAQPQMVVYTENQKMFNIGLI